MTGSTAHSMGVLGLNNYLISDYKSETGIDQMLDFSRLPLLRHRGRLPGSDGDLLSIGGWQGISGLLRFARS